MVPGNGKKPLSLAIQELESGQVKIVSEEDEEEEVQVQEQEQAEAAEEPAVEEEAVESAESEE